jgi:hypothetical protein
MHARHIAVCTTCTPACRRNALHCIQAAPPHLSLYVWPLRGHRRRFHHHLLLLLLLLLLSCSRRQLLVQTRRHLTLGPWFNLHTRDSSSRCSSSRQLSGLLLLLPLCPHAWLLRGILPTTSRGCRALQQLLQRRQRTLVGERPVPRGAGVLPVPLLLLTGRVHHSSAVSRACCCGAVAACCVDLLPCVLHLCARSSSSGSTTRRRLEQRG